MERIKRSRVGVLGTGNAERLRAPPSSALHSTVRLHFLFFRNCIV